MDRTKKQLEAVADSLAWSCDGRSMTHNEVRDVRDQWIAEFSLLSEDDASYVAQEMIARNCNPEMVKQDLATAAQRRLKTTGQRLLPYAVVVGVVLVGALGYAMYTTTRKRP